MTASPLPRRRQSPRHQGLGQALTPEQVAALSWAYDSLAFGEVRLLLERHAGNLDRPAAAEAIAAGFTHRDGGNGIGFEAGGPLDGMLPGWELAAHLGRVRRRGLAVLSDGALIGAMGAAARLESFAAEFKLGAMAELDARRRAADGSPGEHVGEEVAAALTVTDWSAAALLGLAQELARLPKTRTLLAAGIIDARRAAIIVRHLILLSDQDAARAEDLILRRAGLLTTGELGSLCQRVVTRIDPAAARKRKQHALRQARVEAWLEDTGTGALAGRDLDPAEMITADQYITQAARWLKANGVPATQQQLRARVFTALLAGQTLDWLLDTLLPPDAPGAQDVPAAEDSPAAQDAPAANDAPPASAPLAQDTPPAQDTPAAQDAPPAQDAPAGQHAPAADVPAGGPAGPALGGTVNLTMPLSAFLGRTDNPGEIAGYGAADADTCRDLGGRLAAGTDVRWCITLTDSHGRPAGHGCARAGPGPPATADPLSWVATVTIHPIETTTCAHRRQSTGYQPSPGLRHIIKTRSPRCGYPGCRRPAIRCDDDHTIAHHLGGRTCECNLYPLCRKHHQCKQAPGWQLRQPRPGHLIWTTPSGRTYTKITEPYPV